MELRPADPPLTVSRALQMIDCNNYYIDLCRERITTGYCVDQNQHRLDAYLAENKRLNDFIEMK